MQAMNRITARSAAFLGGTAVNALLILLLSAAVLAGGYWLYGRWIENSWGIDPAAVTPAVRRHDHTDFIASRSWLLLAYEFVSVCAVLVVFGPVAAARYGWVPVLVWILLGGVFIGGVQEYCAVYVSVKDRGVTLAGLVERFAGLRWKKVFLVFTWLLCVAAIAAFADIAAHALDGFLTVEEADPVRGRAGTVVLLMYVFAVLMGLATRYSKIRPWATKVISVTILLCSFMLGMLFPASLRPSLWHIIILSFALLSAAGPVWLTMHPRANLHVWLYGALLLLLLAGVVAGPGKMALAPYTGFSVDGQGLFPWLFVMLTYGAVSGVQALSASSVISRQVRGEVRMRRIAFGGVMLECFVAVLVLVCVGTRMDAAQLSGAQDPGALFLSAVGEILARFGISAEISGSLYTLLIACMCIGGLESLARVARVTWQEFFDFGDEEPGFLRYAAANGWVGAGATLLAAFILARVGYSAIWPLFGSANQAVSGLALLICAIWLRRTRRTGAWVWAPMLLVLLVSLAALIAAVINGVSSIVYGSLNLISDIVSVLISAAIFVTTVLLCFQGLRALLRPVEPPQEQ